MENTLPVVSVADVTALRSTKPTATGQLITLVEYNKGTGLGGGTLICKAISGKTSSDDDGCRKFVTTSGALWERVGNHFTVADAGGIPYNDKVPASVDSSPAINRYCASMGTLYPWDLSGCGGPWRLTQTIDATKATTVIVDEVGKFIVESDKFTAKHTTPFVITFGNPDGDTATDRFFGKMHGMLYMTGTRTKPLNGVYIKASISSFDTIRVAGFNGSGYMVETTWDSTIDVLSCELCGNTDTYAGVLSKGTDTTNCMSINRIQCEQAYHKSLKINVIRSNIRNIHAERTYVLSNDDGNPTLATKYANVEITLGNSIVGQAIFDSELDLSLYTAKNLTPPASVILSGRIEGDFSRFDSLVGPSIISTGWGTGSTFSNVNCRDWYWGGDAAYNSVNDFHVSGILSAYQKTDFSSGTVNQVSFLKSANNVRLHKVDFTLAYQFPNIILGSIVFEDCTWPAGVTLYGTRAPSGTLQYNLVNETQLPVTFIRCRINGTYTGSDNSRAVFRDSYIDTVSLASGTATEFYDCTGKSFTYNENPAFLTRGQNRFVSVLKWNPPERYVCVAGMKTERMGALKTGDALLYVCKGTGVNSGASDWVGMLPMP